jgi:hypothetical protein
MRALGLLLVIAGVVVLVNKGISYTKTTKLIDTGPVQASVRHTEHVYLEPLVGVCGIAGGVLLILLGRRRKEG